MNPAIGKWVEDTFVTFERDLFTVTPEGNLELRGNGWGPTRRGHGPKVERRKKRTGEFSDEVRVCKFGSVKRARRMAEVLAKLLWEQHRVDLIRKAMPHAKITYEDVRWDKTR
jgi:hypothetical protein